MQFTVHTAKSQLSKLIDEALAGEEVVIAKGSKPVVRLVPIVAGKFAFGTMAQDLAGPTPEFTEPLDADELDAWEGGA